MTIACVLFLSFSVGYCGVGYLDVISDPEGVKIFINGKEVGLTPITGVEVLSGKVTIKAMKDNYGAATEIINIGDDEVRRIKIHLQKTNEITGTPQDEIVIKQDTGDLLVINTNDSLVSIDNKQKGKGSIKIKNIAAGKHLLSMGNFQKEINIYKGYLLKVKNSNDGILVLNDLEEIRIKKKKDAIKNEKERKKKDLRRKQEAEKIAAKKRKEEQMRSEVEKFRSGGYEREFQFNYSGSGVMDGNCKDIGTCNLKEEGDTCGGICNFDFNKLFLGNDGNVHDLLIKVTYKSESKVARAMGWFSSPKINSSNNLSTEVYLDDKKIASDHSRSAGWTFSLKSECNKIDKSLKNDTLKIHITSNFIKRGVKSKMRGDINGRIERLDWKTFDKMLSDYRDIGSIY